MWRSEVAVDWIMFVRGDSEEVGYKLEEILAKRVLKYAFWHYMTSSILSTCPNVSILIHRPMLRLWSWIVHYSDFRVRVSVPMPTPIPCACEPSSSRVHSVSVTLHRSTHSQRSSSPSANCLDRMSNTKNASVTTLPDLSAKLTDPRKPHDERIRTSVNVDRSLSGPFERLAMHKYAYGPHSP
jgi:hypothetical protein